MAKVGLYKGFSFFQFQSTRSFQVLDVECVKRDIVNHIFTLQGSRVMQPSFGTIIPQLVFEPLDQELTETLQAELERVFGYDPRVELLNMTITPNYDSGTVIMSATLLYLELNIVDNFELNIQFEN